MLTIKFGLWIQDYEMDEPSKLDGPVFTRWLPDGENDALKVTIDRYSAEVYLWFERHGFIDDSGFIRYEHKRFEIDPNVLPRQEKVYAGALYGKIILNEISEAQVSALINHEVESEEYVTLGKLVLKKILDPVLIQFTKLLKNTYGQYWIEVYKPFDSRNLALSNHCSRLNMKWHLSDEESGDFVPGKKEIQTISFTVSASQEKEYIDRNAWFHLESLLNNKFEPDPLNLSHCVTIRESPLRFPVFRGNGLFSTLATPTVLMCALQRWPHLPN